MFQNESSDITLKSSIQEGMFQFVQDKRAVLNKTINNSNKVLEKSSIKKDFWQKNKGKGLIQSYTLSKVHFWLI
jgi:hypothetical protein